MMRNLLTISYAKRVLEEGSREQERMVRLARGTDRLVMVVFTRAAEGRASEYHKDNLTVYATNSRSRIAMLFDAYRIAVSLISESGEEWVVSAQDPFETSLVAYPVAKKTGSKFQLQVHGDNFNNPYWRNESFLNRLRHWFGVRMLRRAELIRVVSHRTQLAIERLGIKAPVVVLPVQTDLSQFLTVGRKRLFEPKSHTRFLYVGRFSPEKEVVRIVKLFAEVHKEQPNCRLTLLGEGAEKVIIMKTIKQYELLDAVSILPWTDDVPGVMEEHDVFILASRHEGFALVLLEAMAAGLAIITTDVGCVGEWCLPGEHCLVIPHDNNETAVVTWIQLAKDTSLQQRLAKAGCSAADHYQDEQSDYETAWTASFGI